MEYAVQAWAPWQVGDLEMLEKVQRRMVAAVTGLVGSSYEEKLKEINMETLAARREKLDMQQTYKIISGKEDVDQRIWFTRINEDRPVRRRLAEAGLNLDQSAARLEIRRNFYSQRVLAPWNRLPQATKSSKNVAEFKRKLG